MAPANKSTCSGPHQLKIVLGFVLGFVLTFSISGICYCDALHQNPLPDLLQLSGWKLDVHGVRIHLEPQELYSLCWDPLLSKKPSSSSTFAALLECAMKASGDSATSSVSSQHWTSLIPCCQASHYQSHEICEDMGAVASPKEGTGTGMPVLSIYLL